MLRLECKPYYVNQLKMANTCSIVLIGASRLMSLLVLLKAIACLVVVF
jgi:hypothetical protein